MATITISNLSKWFGNQRVLSDIDLEVGHGEFIALLGPSGCGKTTLLRLIAGLETPNSGLIRLGDINITHLSPEKRNVALMFQSYALMPHMTVFENVAFPLRVHTTLPEDMIRDIVLMKLEAVGLRGARDLMPAELSGGMTRRVALARMTPPPPAPSQSAAVGTSGTVTNSQ